MSSPPIERVARETFGFETLRPGQREAIESVLRGRDTLVAMSAGTGKSAIHQIAGFMHSGVTIVIRPQVVAAAPAESLEVAPEQLAEAEVLDRMRAAAPTLIAVEDAHCISEAGDDFRPDYLRLGAFVAEMGHPTVLALTATAAPPICDQIIERLHMHDPFVVVRGFDGANA